MGLSHAAAAGILFTAAVVTGFNISDDVYNQQDDLAEAWEDYFQYQLARASTDFTITDIKPQGGNSRVFMTNTGALPIDPDLLSFVYNGGAVTATAWVMDPPSQPPQWGPGRTIMVTVGAPRPTHAIVAEATGHTEVWTNP